MSLTSVIPQSVRDFYARAGRGEAKLQCQPGYHIVPEDLLFNNQVPSSCLPDPELSPDPSGTICCRPRPPLEEPRGPSFTATSRLALPPPRYSFAPRGAPASRYLGLPAPALPDISRLTTPSAIERLALPPARVVVPSFGRRETKEPLALEPPSPVTPLTPESAVIIPPSPEVEPEIVPPPPQRLRTEGGMVAPAAPSLPAQRRRLSVDAFTRIQPTHLLVSTARVIDNNVGNTIETIQACGDVSTGRQALCVVMRGGTRLYSEGPFYRTSPSDSQVLNLTSKEDLMNAPGVIGARLTGFDRFDEGVDGKRNVWYSLSFVDRTGKAFRLAAPLWQANPQATTKDILNKRVTKIDRCDSPTFGPGDSCIYLDNGLTLFPIAQEEGKLMREDYLQSFLDYQGERREPQSGGAFVRLQLPYYLNNPNTEATLLETLIDQNGDPILKFRLRDKTSGAAVGEYYVSAADYYAESPPPPPSYALTTTGVPLSRKRAREAAQPPPVEVRDLVLLQPPPERRSTRA